MSTNSDEESDGDIDFDSQVNAIPEFNGSKPNANKSESGLYPAELPEQTKVALNDRMNRSLNRTDGHGYLYVLELNSKLS